MATIAGGLSQQNFVQTFSSNPSLAALSFGLIPAGGNVTYDSLNTLGKFYSLQTFSIYEMLGGTAPGGLSADGQQTFQAFAQFYSILDIMLFGRFIGLGGTVIS